MGANGRLRVTTHMSMTASANLKTLSIELGGAEPPSQGERVPIVAIAQKVTVCEWAVTAHGEDLVRAPAARPDPSACTHDWEHGDCWRIRDIDPEIASAIRAGVTSWQTCSHRCGAWRPIGERLTLPSEKPDTWPDRYACGCSWKHVLLGFCDAYAPDGNQREPEAHHLVLFNS